MLCNASKIIENIKFNVYLCYNSNHYVFNQSDLTSKPLFQNGGIVYIKLPVIASNDVSSSVEERLMSRKRRVQQTCEKIGPASDVTKQRWPKLRLAGNRLHICGLEKIASSFIRFLMRQEKKQTGYIPKATETEFKSLVIVREPYSRLLSAYFDKLFTSPTWTHYHHYGRYIIENFRFNATDESIDCASGVTFPEFVRYTIHAQETDKERNPHFDPMHRRCQFCHRDYDYYVHLETLSSDMDYVYKSVNATLVPELKDEQQAIRSKAHETVAKRNNERCQSVGEVFRRAWYSFQARGFFAADMKLPLTEQEMATVTEKEFAEVCWKAHVESVGRMNKSKQRRDTVVEMYSQVPLLDRLKLRQIFLKDFQLHGYDSTPADLFPELQLKS